MNKSKIWNDWKSSTLSSAPTHFPISAHHSNEFFKILDSLPLSRKFSIRAPRFPGPLAPHPLIHEALKGVLDHAIIQIFLPFSRIHAIKEKN